MVSETFGARQVNKCRPQLSYHANLGGIAPVEKTSPIQLKHRPPWCATRLRRLQMNYDSIENLANLAAIAMFVLIAFNYYKSARDKDDFT
jgi:hypothetical protein